MRWSERTATVPPQVGTIAGRWPGTPVVRLSVSSRAQHGEMAYLLLENVYGDTTLSDQMIVDRARLIAALTAAVVNTHATVRVFGTWPGRDRMQLALEPLRDEPGSVWMRFEQVWDYGSSGHVAVFAHGDLRSLLAAAAA